ncbi:YbaK/EbsC family protein [Agromyces endophyticus]|uniref:YbaK/EbsC family protein n=1 Tax=Agromyces sp. H17E-10 TaxID=2932244 RepID=UPI001FD010AC|nr:YbaK/EbsC family protein [Agromyces sp. H17E-10]UOQ90950.1 YbaK/EbsC family protein [Agromyces sp. H17E-10]
MRFGTLDFTAAVDSPELLAAPTAAALAAAPDGDVLVAAIDASLADTAAFCEHYEISPADGANCVVVQARRGERTWYAACLVRGADRLDVNGAVRRHLDARKLSFAPMDLAVELTGMQVGGITPVGLPDGWPILVDESVAAHERLIIGSGNRDAKLLVSGAYLARLPGAEVLPIAIPSAG